MSNPHRPAHLLVRAPCRLVYWFMVDYWIEPATSLGRRLETAQVQKEPMPHCELAESDAHGVQYTSAVSVMVMGKYCRSDLV